MEFNHKSGIDIITGPMFSGKTTELVRRLGILNSANFKVVYVNSTIDTRKNISHNSFFNGKLSIDSIRTESLFGVDLMDYDVIGIDEAQFFSDLYFYCLEMCERYGKKIIVSGLNSDFQRNKFGQIMELVPICDTVVTLASFCKESANKNQFIPALFSKRIDKCNQNSVSVGAGESYIPVCRICYFT